MELTIFVSMTSYLKQTFLMFLFLSGTKGLRYFWREWRNPFLISRVYFGVYIKFLGLNFVNIKAEKSDTKHLG